VEVQAFSFPQWLWKMLTRYQTSVRSQRRLCGTNGCLRRAVWSACLSPGGTPYLTVITLFNGHYQHTSVPFIWDNSQIGWAKWQHTGLMCGHTRLHRHTSGSRPGASCTKDAYAQKSGVQNFSLQRSDVWRGKWPWKCAMPHTNFRAGIGIFLQLLILWRHLEVMLGNCYNK